ncbi:hypothetical protein [Streptomyces lasiicapitis]|uniref:Uncharacterized protein n=1 Tax=Streptomyces lasiicapitis TaxID=1923961 RepID=A0ABQ2ML40_9ACTN|nr:hypothetical protein [Streptomyces lasiicapitis]GGO54265.1 hypothetical protein GCM10012286_63620 [Streptomyces lasiicapitis]
MRHGRPTDEQLKKTFVAVLGDVLTGQGVRTCTGLDESTDAALWAIAKAYPEVSLDLVDAARAAFAGQLDGSNAARWYEDLKRRFEAMESEAAPGAAGVPGADRAIGD